jgi:hypothetical protein
MVRTTKMIDWESLKQKRGPVAVILFLLFLLKGIFYLVAAGWFIDRITS